MQKEGEGIMKKKKKFKKMIIRPALDLHGGVSYPGLSSGVADPAGSYTGVPILFEEPEQDVDDL